MPTTQTPRDSAESARDRAETLCSPARPRPPPGGPSCLGAGLVLPTRRGAGWRGPVSGLQCLAATRKPPRATYILLSNPEPVSLGIAGDPSGALTGGNLGLLTSSHRAPQGVSERRGSWVSRFTLQLGQKGGHWPSGEAWGAVTGTGSSAQSECGKGVLPRRGGRSDALPRRPSPIWARLYQDRRSPLCSGHLRLSPEWGSASRHRQAAPQSGLLSRRGAGGADGCGWLRAKR